jgi:hypothetical protein
MEALAIIGLIGIGLLSSNDEEDNTNTNIKKDIHLPTSDNLYNSSFYEKSNQIILNKSARNFESSMDEDSKVISNIKENRDGSGYLDNIVTELDNNMNDTKENFADYIYSNVTDEYISRGDFMLNDQGISTQPYFKHAPTPIDLNDTRSMDRHQGDNKFNVSKKEQPQFFEMEKNVGNVFGNQFGEYIGDKSRYNESSLRTNELPFEQQKITNIDVKSPINREIGQIMADRSSIDNLRSKADPKLTYKGKLLPGKNVAESRGSMGEFVHRNPDTFYENSQDRLFVTNGAYLENSERPEQIMKDTFRSKFNNQPIGPAAPNYTQGEKRSNYKQSSRMQLENDSNRNVGAGNFIGDADYSRNGYKAYPNEREVTGQRTYESNVSGEVSNHIMGIMDDIKDTKKQTTINSKNNGYMANTSVNNTMGILDNVRTTKKQTTIDSKNNGYIHGGYNERSAGYEAPEMTTKDSTLSSYMGGAGADVLGNTGQTNYMNAELNPNKEIISKGRTPTQNNTKIVNGGEDMNVFVKKLNADYINYRENGISKVYDSNIGVDQYASITTMKDKLDDRSVASRIDGDILNPFKENPYTQSLSSFAY